MKRIDFRILIGAGLILLGALILLDRVGLFHGELRNIFWGVLFLIGGSYFIYRFISNPHEEWWAAIPGSALVGIGLDSLVPSILDPWTGFFFLGFLGLGFLAVYFTGRERWWSLIPGGVLITLGITSLLSDIYGLQETGGIFFIGLGITFFLVAILASMQWAYIPGVILLVIGALLGTSFAGVLNYVWPAALILGGLWLIFQYARRAGKS
jgi:hypothetical protein